ncbi:transglycosylase SLT domain-containing protein [Yinghuangia soli]|uniref:Lytic transglycosylase domain-containing protein n=1 Tax=Yinghuangia soli TaxID=2908204 RepID=A0AA41PZG6_9ACTN|nr:transglycosylase SLT domain-containing protein [Yinghuangia soli]MCF2528185.1 lytic transglycosylase domain-containing protein [Yinghuangia soli]
MASATAVTAVGAVVGITGTGASTSNAQTVDTASSTTKLLDVPGTAQVQQVSDGVLQQADAQTAAYDEAQRFAAAEAARIQAEQQAAADKAAADQAAAKAAADKAAADKAAADKAAAERAAQAASRSETRTPVTTGDPKAIARSMMNETQFTCFSNIVQKESGWRVTATNPSSGAYGLVQALPGSKMATAGADWRTNPATQIKWGLDYMNKRYGSPCGAWSFWQKNHWY